MRIAVLGGAGFAGGHLSTYFADRDHEVLAVDNLVRPGSEMNLPRLVAAGVRVRRADVRCAEDWVEIRAFQPAAIIDAAAQPSAVAGYRNPRLDFTANTFAVLHALELCRETGAALVFFSTNKVYPVAAVDEINGEVQRCGSRWHTDATIGELCPLDGGDRSLYGASKVMADLMVQEWADAFGFPAIVNRCSCLSGPWQWGHAEQGWVAWWVIAHHLGLPLEYIGFEGRQVRDVLHIDDLCRLIEAQLGDPQSGPEVFNVGGGAAHSLSLRECTELCQRITGRQTPINQIGDPRRADFRYYVSDITKASARYGWAPTAASDPESLIDDIYRWVRDHSGLLRFLFPDAPCISDSDPTLAPVDPVFAAHKDKQGYRSAVQT